MPLLKELKGKMCRLPVMNYKMYCMILFCKKYNASSHHFGLQILGLYFLWCWLRYHHIQLTAPEGNLPHILNFFCCFTNFKFCIPPDYSLCMSSVFLPSVGFARLICLLAECSLTCSCFAKF